MAPTDWSSLTHLDVATARQLAKEKGVIKLPSLQNMSLDAAQELARFSGDALIIQQCNIDDAVAEALFPAAARILIGFQDLRGDDVNVFECAIKVSLSQSVARLYAAMAGATARFAGKSVLLFRHPGALSPQALHEVVTGIGPKVTLRIEGVDKIPEEWLAALAQCSAQIDLPSLAMMTEALAKALTACDASVRISRATQMTSRVFGLISKTEGRIYFPEGWERLEREDVEGDLEVAFKTASCGISAKVTELSANVARALACAGFKDIQLYGIANLTSAAASELAGFPRQLSMSSAVYGDDEGHAALATRLSSHASTNSWWKWSFDPLGPRVAAALANSGRDPLHVDVTGLSLAAAEALTQCRGDLQIRTQSPITAEVARVLSTKKGAGALEIMCDTISDEVAESLTGCSAPLRMPWLKVVTKAAAKALCCAPGFPGGSAMYFVETLYGVALYDGDKRNLTRLVLVDEPASFRELPPQLGSAHPRLEQVDVERCHGLSAFDFRGRKNATPRAEPQLRIRVVDCASLTRIVLLTERSCANSLELRRLPKCLSVVISTPDLKDLRPLQNLESVRYLVVQRCESLRSLDGVASLSKLSSLTIASAPALVSLTGLEALGELTGLSLSDCPSIESIDQIAALPKLRQVEIKGATSIKSLRSMRGRVGLRLQIESDGIGLPPSLAKTQSSYGIKSLLGHFERAIVECEACGGTKFTGSCHGRHARVQRAEVRRSERLASGTIVAPAQALVKSLVAKLNRGGLRDVEGATEFEMFPTLDADVKCETCGAFLEPSSFGAQSDDSGDWAEVGKSREPYPNLQSWSNLVVAFDEDASAEVRERPDPNKCPICAEGMLRVSVVGVARCETTSDFRGHVALDRSTWGALPDCFHVVSSGESKCAGWHWETPPRVSNGARVACENGCFAAFMSSAEELPAVILAVIAAREAVRETPSADRMTDWLSALGRDAGNAARLIESACEQLGALDPEVVPRRSKTQEPEEAFGELKEKASHLMRDALAALAAKQVERLFEDLLGETDEGDGSRAVPDRLRDRTFYFAGSLAGRTRDEAVTLVKKLGAKVVAKLTRNVTDVVVGRGAGRIRAQAEEMGLRLLDLAGFNELVGGEAAVSDGPTWLAPLRGRVFCLAGLGKDDIEEYEETLVGLGAQTVRRLTDAVTDVVVDYSDEARVRRARQRGLEVLDLDELSELVRKVNELDADDGDDE